MGQDRTELRRYLSLMEDIKKRIGYVGDVLNRRVTFGAEYADYEIISLHFRKILECIAFASLVANKEEYEARHSSFADHWRAKQLLSRMSEINVNFYPVAFTIEEVKPGHKHLAPLSEGFLTPDEFIFLYDVCSETIHTWNPYSSKDRSIDFRRAPVEWLRRIWTLLGNHMISFVGIDDKWLITMVDASDGKAHGLTSVKVGPLPEDWKK